MPVLSLGLLIKQHGFDLIWRKAIGPLQKGTDPKTKCWESNDAPFIVAAYQMNSVDEGPLVPDEIITPGDAMELPPIEPTTEEQEAIFGCGNLG